MPKIAKPILIDSSVPVNSGNADFLYNTANNSLYYRNRETLQWVQISGGLPDPDQENDENQSPSPSYLTTSQAALIYLSKSSASVQFGLQSQSLNSASTYIVNNFATLNSPYFSGNVNFSSASVIGLGTYISKDILPIQSGNSNRYLFTDGSNVSWRSISGGGGGIDDATAIGYASSASANADIRAFEYASSASANVNNLSQSRDDLKANTSSPTFTGTVTAPHITVSGSQAIEDFRNRNVYISTASPSAGNDGDIWIRYT